MAEKDIDSKLDAIAAHLDSLHKRMDSDAEERKADKARFDAACSRMDAAYEEGKADKARKDAEEMAAAEKCRKDAQEKEEKERADAEAKADKERCDAAARAAASPEILAQIKALEARIPVALSDADRTLFVGAQVKAERVAQAFGDSDFAPRWMNGETLPDYQRRLLGKYKAHSAAWKDKDLARVDASVLDVAETQIYADAVVAASAPSSVVAGTLREQITSDDTGRRIRRFHGDTDVTWAPFKQPVRSITAVRTNFNHA